ncbi:hypothetical protein [Micromonospora chalcea]|uniref:hypothetical protein n=1 Tax=Micromonospora chalcea TaxID=1874 RepID=UPI003D72D6FB
MSARARAGAALAGVALVAALAGCGQAGEAQPEDVVVVEVEATDDEPDGWDCEDKPGDRERTNREQPDCGRYVKGRWVEWSWVARGERPPAGWTPAREAAASPATSAPRRVTVRPTTKPAPKRTDSR